MANEANNARDYGVGYGKPPRHSQFQPGQSGNPSGRRRKAPPASLTEALAEQMSRPLRNAKGGRGKMTARHIMIRNLIERAAGGDRSSLVDLITIRKNAGPVQAPRFIKVPFRKEAEKRAERLTDAFFEKQDRAKAHFREKYSMANLPFADLIDRELARRVRATRGGKEVRVSMMELIAMRFTSEAFSDGAAIKLLQKLVPEKKRFTPPTFTEVERPTQEDIEWLEARREEEERLMREDMDGPTIGEMIEARRRAERGE